MIYNSLYLSIRYVLSLHKFSKSIPDYISVTDSSYTGLDSQQYPVRNFKGKRNLNRTVILYPGASPTAERHPAFQFLGAALANVGFNVFIPRIPPLKKLDVSESNVEWFQNAYKQLTSHEDIQGTSVTCIAVSFGGAILMKCLSDGFMRDNEPRCILTYGTMYDVETSLSYMMKAESNINGKIVKFKPHEWAMVVCFHNFLPSVDVGYSTEFIQKILSLRVKDMDYKNELKQLEGDHLKLAEDVLSSTFSPEVMRILHIIMDKKKTELDAISPKLWASKINSKVFIMHGAADNMVPYNQAKLLAQNIKNSEYFISYLYEHNEISDKTSSMHKVKEMIRLIKFFNRFIKHHEN